MLLGALLDGSDTFRTQVALADLSTEVLLYGPTPPHTHPIKKGSKWCFLLQNLDLGLLTSRKTKIKFWFPIISIDLTSLSSAARREVAPNVLDVWQGSIE